MISRDKEDWDSYFIIQIQISKMKRLLLFIIFIIFFYNNNNNIIIEAAKPSKQPHIIVLIIDDVGWTDVGYRNGSQMLTPNIDSLRETGVTLERYYTQPVCSPSRAALMQGRYPFHTGMQHYETIMPTSHAHMPMDQPTLAEFLNDNGYHSTMVGKWHLGYANWSYTPTERGFETHLGYYQGMEDYYSKNFSVPHKYISANITGYDWWANKTVAWKDNGTYNTDLFNNEADRILADYVANRKITNDDKPLFMYYAHQIVHIPLEAPQVYINRCKHIQDKDRRTYCGMMAALDDSINHFINSLKKYNLWDDTLLIVSTDNGGDPNYGDFPRSAGCNWPLRAGKATVFEGGVRAVGFVTGGDNIIPKNSRNTTCKELIHLVDWFPTLALLANESAELPDNLDGHDLWPVIFEDKPTPRQDIPLNINFNISYPDSGVQVGILKGDWKLVYHQMKGSTMVYDGWYPPPPGKVIKPPSNPSGKYLFNLANDPNEYNNLYDKAPQKVKELEDLLAQYMKGYQAPQYNGFDFSGIPRFHNGTWAPWI